MVAQALSVPAVTWVSVVRDRMRDWPGGAIPSVVSLPAFGSKCLDAARGCPVLREQLIRCYRLDYVRPCIISYDRAAFQAAASYSFEALG